MRRVASIGLLIAGLVAPAGAAAQNVEDLQLCRAIADDAGRLACYDAIDIAPGPRPKYETVALPDLKTYALSYRGQLVEVSGFVKTGKELLFLGTDADDARPVPIDLNSISRRSRQAFLAACGDGCEATVQGRVRPVNFTTGIVADALIAH